MEKIHGIVPCSRFVVSSRNDLKSKISNFEMFNSFIGILCYCYQISY